MSRRPVRVIRQISLGAAGLLSLALGAGSVYEQWSRWNVARVYPPPGDLVEFDGARSQLHCIGDGSPIVLLEAGLDINGSFSWRRVQPDVAVTTRVCAYDRAGILWSEPRQEPRDARRIADELHALLAAASEPPPYVMVGHSLGGLLVRVYARRFKGEVVGFVLVDSAHPLQNWRMPRMEMAFKEAPPPPLVTKFRPLMTKFLSRTGVTRLTTDPPKDPPLAFARTSLSAVHAEVQAFVEICAQAAETGKLGDLPLVVLTAGRRFPMSGMSEKTQNAFHDTRFALQAELAMLSTNSDQRVSPRAGHYIQLDDPDAVVTAIEDVVTAVRDGTRVRGATVAAVHEGTPVRKAALHPRAGAGPGRGYRSSHPGSSPPSSRQVSLAAAMSRPPEAP
jgi:pimeloyl-ACP methyl ester carboxylesterase